MNQKRKHFSHNNTRLHSNDAVTVASLLKVKSSDFLGQTDNLVCARYRDISITVSVDCCKEGEKK